MTDDSVRTFLETEATESKPAAAPVFNPDPHLTKSQLAARAVLELLPALETEAKTRQGRRGLKSSAKAHDLAGKAAGVGGSIISDAKVVHKRNPELFQKIVNGELTVNEAYREVKGLATPPRPRKPAQRQIDYTKRKMIDVLSQIRGLCRALSMMDIPTMADELSTSERRTWIGISREISSELRNFRQRLLE